MRKPVLVFAVLFLSLVVAWFASRGSEAGTPAGAPLAAESPSAREPSTLAEGVTPAAEGPVETAREHVDLAPETPMPAVASPACSVFGVVVDEAGAPLEGVVVVLSAYLRWSRDVEGPALPPEGRSRGWSTSTDAGGRFRFDVPPPGMGSIQALSFTPDPYHDSHIVRFGRDGRPSLLAGELDLGLIRLVATGAIEGHVRDTAGRALASAQVRIANSRETTLGREATSDASGRYRIGHVKPGTYGVNCEHEGHVSEFRTPFVVAPGSTTEGVDFELKPAPTLRGRVVDVEDTPLEGIRVWGWPQSSGKGAGATTAADGSFTIFLPQNEPYRLEAKLDKSDAFGMGDATVHYPPNTDDIELVLPKTMLVTVAVLDAASGAPIERFALRVERRAGPNDDASSLGHRLTSAPQPVAQPGGEVQVRVRPGIDGYLLVATGFEDAAGDFDSELAQTGRLELRLGRGPSIGGRATLRGESVAGVTATLERGSMRAPPGSRELSFYPDSYRTTQSTRTEADGRFRFDGIENSESYRLTLRAAGGECLVLAPVMSKAGPLELGDLELQPAAILAGGVLVPPGRSRAGLVVRLDDLRSGPSVITDHEGSFRFEGVAPGRHNLFVDEAPGRLASAGPFPVEVAPGAIGQVELDCRDRGTCEVKLSVRFTDGSAEGYHVELAPTGPNSRPHTLGRLDERGRVESWAPALGPAGVRLRGPDGTSWRHPIAVLDLAHDARLDVGLEFEVASLALVLPDAFTLPNRASVTMLLSTAAGSEPFVVKADLHSGAAADGVGFDGRRLRFARVPSGAHALELRIHDAVAQPVRVQTSSNSWKVTRPPVLEHRADVTLLVGRETELDLP